MLIVIVHGVGLANLEAVPPASEPQAFIQECLDAGFKTTWIWDYSERVITETVTKSFLVTDATSENVTIGIVHRAASGTLQVRLDGPDGPLVMLDRRALDAEVTLELPRGEYSFYSTSLLAQSDCVETSPTQPRRCAYRMDVGPLHGHHPGPAAGCRVRYRHRCRDRMAIVLPRDLSARQVLRRDR